MLSSQNVSQKFDKQRPPTTHVNMPFSISPVEADDVDQLIRRIQYPTHQSNPLTLLMFPHSRNEIRPEHREREIQWEIDGLLDTVHRGDEILYKACGIDGSPVGLIGWTHSPGTFSKTTGKDTRSSHATSGGSRTVMDDPPTLDVTAWLQVSRKLRDERQRVLQGYQGKGICRITFMAVDPEYQRQGIGTMLMELFCRQIDEKSLDAFVLSSPAGIRLYTKFGFKQAGAVETTQGAFISLLRSGSEVQERMYNIISSKE
ncbi:acyl-CoA N-acyltransferase [Aspergillus ambiguus]|uniref:GNAT family N-acetyltransferase n=1 Tax=Aspergillus ambiguus TaxID=176160 RepID=UPI003CCCADDA